MGYTILTGSGDVILGETGATTAEDSPSVFPRRKPGCEINQHIINFKNSTNIRKCDENVANNH